MQFLAVSAHLRQLKQCRFVSTDVSRQTSKFKLLREPITRKRAKFGLQLPNAGNSKTQLGEVISSQPKKHISPDKPRKTVLRRPINGFRGLGSHPRTVPSPSSDELSGKDTVSPPMRQNIPKWPHDILRARRKGGIQVIEAIIQARYGTNYTVHEFGGTVYGAEDASSDVDLVIFDAERSAGFTPDMPEKSLPEIYRVRSLAKVLRNGGFDVLECRTFATVPVVKFRQKRSGATYDIIVNERLGYHNSHLIKLYCGISPPLCSVISAVKQWAKSQQLVGGSFSKFTSYALALMTISVFQHWGLLPNLQRQPLPESEPGAHIFWARLSKGRRVPCDIRYHGVSGQKETAKVSRDKLLEKWFSYWGEEHRYGHEVACIRRGGILKATSDEIAPPSGHSGGELQEPPKFLRVMDPFIAEKNTTQQLNIPFLQTFRTQCLAQRRKLIAERESPGSPPESQDSS